MNPPVHKQEKPRKQPYRWSTRDAIPAEGCHYKSREKPKKEECPRREGARRIQGCAGMVARRENIGVGGVKVERIMEKWNRLSGESEDAG